MMFRKEKEAHYVIICRKKKYDITPALVVTPSMAQDWTLSGLVSTVS